MKIFKTLFRKKRGKNSRINYPDIPVKVSHFDNVSNIFETNALYSRDVDVLMVKAIGKKNRRPPLVAMIEDQVGVKNYVGPIIIDNTIVISLDDDYEIDCIEIIYPKKFWEKSKETLIPDNFTYANIIFINHDIDFDNTKPGFYTNLKKDELYIRLYDIQDFTTYKVGSSLLFDIYDNEFLVGIRISNIIERDLGGKSLILNL